MAFKTWVSLISQNSRTGMQVLTASLHFSGLFPCRPHLVSCIVSECTRFTPTTKNTGTSPRSNPTLKESAPPLGAVLYYSSSTPRPCAAHMHIHTRLYSPCAPCGESRRPWKTGDCLNDSNSLYGFLLKKKSNLELFFFYFFSFLFSLLAVSVSRFVPVSTRRDKRGREKRVVRVHACEHANDSKRALPLELFNPVTES